jgi:hypothetical protein
MDNDESCPGVFVRFSLLNFTPESFYPAIMIQITEVSLCQTEVLFCSRHYDLTVLGDYYTNGTDKSC